MGNVNKAIRVEVAYAMPKEQVILELNVPAMTTVEQAIEMSGILKRFPSIDLKVDKVGIFGKQCHFEQVLRHQDRIEIYRPLVADPKEVRKRRAREAGFGKK